MALPTFNPPVRPSPGTAHAPQVNIYEAEFGDGYSQPTPNGINHIKRRVSLRWAGLNTNQMHEIIGFFERMGGTKPFYFDPFGMNGTGKWTCKEWNQTTERGIWQVTAELVQSYTNEV